MAKYIVNPEQQIKNVIDCLAETERSLERDGLPVYRLRTWPTQELLLREMQEKHARDELEVAECDDEEE